MKWNQPIFLGFDGMEPDIINGKRFWREYLGNHKHDFQELLQQWYCRTDIGEYFDPNDPDDEPQSTELWIAAETGQDLGGVLRNRRYELTVGPLLIRIPYAYARQAEKKVYFKGMITNLLIHLNKLRRFDFVKEKIWDTRIHKSWTIFDYVDEENLNVENAIAYNQKYEVARKGRRYMGRVLHATSAYRRALGRRARKIVGCEDIDKYYCEALRLHNTPIEELPDITLTDKLTNRVENTWIEPFTYPLPSLKKFRIRREREIDNFKKFIWGVYEKSKTNFLDSLYNNSTQDHEPRLDWGAFYIADAIPHVLYDKETMLEIYRELNSFTLEVSEYAKEQERPVMIFSDHGMTADNSRRALMHNRMGGMLSINVRPLELVAALDLKPSVEARLYGLSKTGRPKPQDIFEILKNMLMWDGY